jgi:hypothetical protein
MGRETYTVADLRDELEGVDGERTVHILSQGAIDDLVDLSVENIEWNNGDVEPAINLKGRCQ